MLSIHFKSRKMTQNVRSVAIQEAAKRELLCPEDFPVLGLPLTVTKRLHWRLLPPRLHEVLLGDAFIITDFVVKSLQMLCLCFLLILVRRGNILHFWKVWRFQTWSEIHHVKGFPKSSHTHTHT